MSDDPFSRLVQELEFCIAERDEARRIACRNEAHLNSMMFDNPKHGDPRAIAESRGWDCFNKVYEEDINAAMDRLSELDEELGL
jgi:hypothetical protein